MIGDNIRALREEKKISQAELAERVGVSQVQISRIELNKSKTKISTMMKIAEALDVEIKDLL